MKKWLILLIFLPLLGIAQTKDQVRTTIKKDFIGLTKDSLLVLFPDGSGTDTLYGKKYDIVKGRLNKVLVTCYLTEPTKEKDSPPQECFHIRIFLVTSYLQSGDIPYILNLIFKKNNNKWLQYRTNDTIVWTYKESQYTVIFDAMKK